MSFVREPRHPHRIAVDGQFIEDRHRNLLHVVVDDTSLNRDTRASAHLRAVRSSNQRNPAFHRTVVGGAQIVSWPSEIRARDIRRSETPAVVFPRVGRFVLRVEVLGIEAGEEIGPLRCAPEMAETDTRVSLLAYGLVSRANRWPCRRGCPSRFHSVENTDGSGLPSGVSLPVSRLSPFMQSSQIASNSSRNRCRATTNEGSPR